MEFPAVGYRNTTSGSLNLPGGEGDYWSSVASSSNYAYHLYFTSGGLSVYYDARQYGFSVRCVR
ncbi:MAG: fibrobacter succinogenes major paralogous domain-containing protein [Rikenellaceae bacterium]|nr:fibrobacter succinogenes major paralogous domain-containing protein [Rikenellaceae bacterium]MDE7356750.1 fibrobacter succinogenes major paralogous domain-containing protein [Rikenellaceae bacterium]